MNALIAKKNDHFQNLRKCLSARPSDSALAASVCTRTAIPTKYSNQTKHSITPTRINQSSSDSDCLNLLHAGHHRSGFRGRRDPYSHYRSAFVFAFRWYSHVAYATWCGPACLSAQGPGQRYPRRTCEEQHHVVLVLLEVQSAQGREGSQEMHSHPSCYGR